MTLEFGWSSVKTVNGLPVDVLDTPLEKCDLKHGDKVTLDFEGRIFSRVIDLESTSLPESPRGKVLSRSPSKSLAAGLIDSTVGVPPSSEDAPSQFGPRKRKSVPVTRLSEEITVPEPKKPRKKLVEKKAGVMHSLYKRLSRGYLFVVCYRRYHWTAY